ncbi:MAG: hypothetical protein R2752_18850 [Vicinamibacterales bacterium]
MGEVTWDTPVVFDNFVWFDDGSGADDRGGGARAGLDGTAVPASGRANPLWRRSNASSPSAA